jgi:shikimate kinase
MRGVGKSTVGKLIAEKLGMSFVDADDEIVQQQQKTIHHLIEENGWDFFRELERDVVKRISERERIVASTGGGVLMFFDNAERLKNTGELVHLRASFITLAERIQMSESRPSLTGKPAEEELAEVWNDRKAIYESCADITIDTDGKTAEEVADMIARQIGKG